MKFAIITCCLLTALISPAFGWGGEGHQAIGDVASKMLTAKARAQVVAILGNDNLGGIASWADDVRGAAGGHGRLADDPDAIQINKDFPHNGNWHFVDMPLDAAGYDPTDTKIAGENDVVHAINRCIGVLDGTDTTTKLSKVEALKFLVHFTGDITQPLHVCSGYYRVDPDKTVHLVTSPADIDGLPSDRGGNSLHYGGDRSGQLHSLWDSGLVSLYAGAGKEADLEAKLESLIVRGSVNPDKGNYHTWAAAWASDSLIQSREVYKGFTFGKASLGDNGDLRSIAIDMDMKQYETDHERIIGLQLAKGAYRLAEILNKIWE